MSACRQPDDAAAAPIRCSNDECDGANDPFEETFKVDEATDTPPDIKANANLGPGIFRGLDADPRVGDFGLDLVLNVR